MKRFSRYSLGLFAAYFVAWTTAYVLMLLSRGDGIDFSRYFEYLGLAWTFRAGELPLFIWLFSILGFVPLAAFVIILFRRHERRPRNAA
jgi:hypothetical protein